MVGLVGRFGPDQLKQRKFDYVHVSDRFVAELLGPEAGMAFGPDASRDEIERAEEVERQRRQQAHNALKKDLEDLVGEAFVRGVEASTDRDANRAYRARSTVLLLVVLAVVAMPIVAILKGLDPDSFGTFIAPITGIAGTVVGFWFSSAKGTTSGE